MLKEKSRGVAVIWPFCRNERERIALLSKSLLPEPGIGLQTEVKMELKPGIAPKLKDSNDTSMFYHCLL
jgi:hypothetical protein